MKLKDQKNILAIVLLICGASSAIAQQDFDAVEVKVHPVTDNIYYLEGSGGNIGVNTGEDGVFLIDDQYAPLTDKILVAVGTISEEPIRFLVNTHMHPDHVGGNENFGKLGTLIFGHDNVRMQMELAGYTEEPPLVTFKREMTFHINGDTVRVFKVPNAHTNGDAYVRFESANVVHTGDVYRTTSYPYIDVSNGGSFLGTIDAYDVLIKVSDAKTKILPGHGVLSNVEAVRTVRDMMLVIRDRVKDRIEAGDTLEQVQAAGLTSEYDERWESGRRIGSAAALLEAAYTDLSK
jgi:glyoxylase-like metal-dependent hydrolase (beta-lactamase superfamily II)